MKRSWPFNYWIRFSDKARRPHNRSYFLAQRRKAAEKGHKEKLKFFFAAFLCGFAPLRETSEAPRILNAQREAGELENRYPPVLIQSGYCRDVFERCARRYLIPAQFPHPPAWS